MLSDRNGINVDVFRRKRNLLIVLQPVHSPLKNTAVYMVRIFTQYSHLLLQSEANPKFKREVRVKMFPDVSPIYV